MEGNEDFSLFCCERSFCLSLGQKNNVCIAENNQKLIQGGGHCYMGRKRGEGGVGVLFVFLPHPIVVSARVSGSLFLVLVSLFFR